MNKKISFPVILCVLLFIILKPVEATNTVKDTIGLWYSKVLPSLFPTMILIKMLLNSNITFKRTQPFCIGTGILCGFPIGAATSLDYVGKGRISKEKGILYATLFNQFSPAFLISYIGIDCLQESPVVVLFIIYGTQFLLFFSLNMLNRFKEQHFKSCELQKNETFPTDVNYKVVDASILSSCEALVKICGYMILCTLINAMVFQISHNQILEAILAPVLEMTSGVATLQASPLNPHIRYSLLFASVSFGGVSGLFQVHNMVKNAEISMAKYTGLKLLSAVTTGIIAYIYYGFSH